MVGQTFGWMVAKIIALAAFRSLIFVHGVPTVIHAVTGFSPDGLIALVTGVATVTIGAVTVWHTLRSKILEAERQDFEKDKNFLRQRIADNAANAAADLKAEQDAHEATRARLEKRLSLLQDRIDDLERLRDALTEANYKLRSHSNP